MGRMKKIINKEEIAEDCCFHCKDGGSMRICDYKDCLKVYHSQCVDKDDSFLESEDPWSCRWHFCFICKRTPKFNCLCCPKAVCGRCLSVAEFYVISVKRGFCHHCLTLAGLIEGVKNSDSDQGEIDFNDKNTYEFMFKCYWEMIKKKEGLTSKHVHHASKLLSMGINSGYSSDSNDISEGEDDVGEFEYENQSISDNDDLNDRKRHEQTNKWLRNKGNPYATKRKIKKKEFNGWGSNLLFNFLESIGKDTTQELSQHDIFAIIIQYCNEHNLFDPVKKKKVVCDAELKSLLGRKTVNKNSIHNLLTPHFAENLEQSEDEFEHDNSEDKDDNISRACKKQRNSSSNRKSQKSKTILDVQQGCFASIVPENIKLLYLKRILVEELSKEPETFEAKVKGSFVRIKSDPYDYSQRNSHQLLKVTGIKKTSRNDEVTIDVLLEVSNMPKDIPICQLSNDNFSEEECEDLRQRVRDGRLERPSVVEFKEKAQSLHEVITKHRIVKELALLQHVINQANEKGWRRQLFESMERMQLLQTPSEQSRLLHEVPEIIADEAEVELAHNNFSRKDEQEKNNTVESVFTELSKPFSKHSGDSPISSCLNDGANFAEDKQQYQGPESEQLVQQHHTVPHESGDDGIHQTESNGSAVEVNQNLSTASHCELISGQFLTSIPQAQSNYLLPEKQQPHDHAISEGKQDRQVDVEYEELKNKKIGQTSELIQISDDEDHDRSGPTSELIQTSDDEEQGKSPTGSIKILDDLNSCIWYSTSPHGIKGGPYSMSMLEEWSARFSGDLNFKVWKTNQSPEEAIFVRDAVRQFFYGK